MSKQEQDRRRELKRRRRELDRIAEQVAGYGKQALRMRPPSTRSKQSKWNHEQSDAIHQARNRYRGLVDEINAIAHELRGER